MSEEEYIEWLIDLIKSHSSKAKAMYHLILGYLMG